MLFLYLIFNSLRVIRRAARDNVTIRRKRSITEVRDRTTRASRTARSARAAASDIGVKLADSIDFLGRESVETRSRARTGRWSDGGLPALTHTTCNVRADENVIDLAVGRTAGNVRPRSARCQPGNTETTRDPRNCSHPQPPRADRAAGDWLGAR